MKDAEIIAYQKRERDFAKTELGAAFHKFESAHANAWVVDSTSNSDKRMREAWNRFDEARANFRALLDKANAALGANEHIYVQDNDDLNSTACAKCGLDLRSPIHTRATK